MSWDKSIHSSLNVDILIMCHKRELFRRRTSGKVKREYHEVSVDEKKGGKIC